MHEVNTVIEDNLGATLFFWIDVSFQMIVDSFFCCCVWAYRFATKPKQLEVHVLYDESRSWVYLQFRYRGPGRSDAKQVVSQITGRFDLFLFSTAFLGYPIAGRTVATTFVTDILQESKIPRKFAGVVEITSCE